MKVYGCPKEIPFEYDFGKYNADSYARAEEEHKAKLLTFLKENGYDGKNTGRIFRTPFADGKAEYLYADTKTGKAILINLPYGDSWHDRNVEFLPKKEVLKRMESAKKMAAMFAKRKGA